MLDYTWTTIVNIVNIVKLNDMQGENILDDQTKANILSTDFISIVKELKHYNTLPNDSIYLLRTLNVSCHHFILNGIECPGSLVGSVLDY